MLGAPAADAEQVSSKQRRAAAGFIDTSYGHTCVILAAGKVRCWGDGLHGKLGYGNVDDIGDNEMPASVGPVPLGAGRRAFALGSGFAHTCALLDNGRVRCWGSGSAGRLGYGNTDEIGDDELPTAVGFVNLGAGRKATAISVGDMHTCAILDTGRVRCWGSGVFGRLGYGNTDSIGDDETPASVAPVQLGGRKAVAISAGGYLTCAILKGGKVKCWGDGSDGALGLGNTSDIGDNETPASVGPVRLGPGRTAVAVAAGLSHACAILDNGKVRCWGTGFNGRLGYGNTNHIGDNELPGSAGPVDIGTDRKAVAITAGYTQTCVILDTGKVRCWGEGSNGRLGYGNTDTIGDNETPGGFGPVNLGAGRKAVAISAGETNACALLDNGRVRCWGSGLDGRLGYGNPDTIGDDETPGAFGPVVLGGLVPRKVRPGLSLALSRKRDQSAPYTVRSAGKLTGFAADPATCSGRIVVKATLGTQTLVKRPKLRRASAECRYAAQFTLPGAGKWRVTARFAGNTSLKARSAKARSFRAG
jgi:alpha-tubulin suppressor-like RCC1 family protein